MSDQSSSEKPAAVRPQDYLATASSSDISATKQKKELGIQRDNV